MEIREVDLEPDLLNRSMLEFHQGDGFVVSQAGSAGARVRLTRADYFVTGTIDGTPGNDYRTVQVLGSGSKCVNDTLLVCQGVVTSNGGGLNQAGAAAKLGAVFATFGSGGPLGGYAIESLNNTAGHPGLVALELVPNTGAANRIAAALVVFDTDGAHDGVEDTRFQVQHNQARLISHSGDPVSYWCGPFQGLSGGVNGLSFHGGLMTGGALVLAPADIPDLSAVYLTVGAGAGFQPLDGDLTALAALAGLNTIYYRSGVSTWSPVVVGAGMAFSGGTLSATGTGTVTSVGSGSGLTGGPITTTGSLSLDVFSNLPVAGIIDGDMVPFTKTGFPSANKSISAADLSRWVLPPGFIMAFGGSAIPAGWLACNGQTVNRVGLYANLFAAIGTTWGVGNGTTTFTLPDLRGRTLLGDGTGAGLSPALLGALSGAESFSTTLGVGNLPAHNHQIVGPSGATLTTYVGGSGAALFSQALNQAAGGSTYVTANTGGGAPVTVSTMQPAAGVKWLIRW